TRSAHYWAARRSYPALGLGVSDNRECAGAAPNDPAVPAVGSGPSGAGELERFPPHRCWDRAYKRVSWAGAVQYPVAGRECAFAPDLPARGLDPPHVADWPRRGAETGRGVAEGSPGAYGDCGVLYRYRPMAIRYPQQVLVGD